MINEKVIELFIDSENEYVSGQAIADALQVSRVAVWKYIEAMREAGYEIESAPKKGYRLVSSPNRISIGEILPFINDDIEASSICCCQSLASTNNALISNALMGDSSVRVMIANEQTHGRGHAGTTFPSPKDTGLYISFIFYPDCNYEEIKNCTYHIAEAACKALSEMLEETVTYSAPNSLCINGNRIAGILTEISVEDISGRVSYIVSGIGINCTPEVLGKKISRPQLAAGMINNIIHLM